MFLLHCSFNYWSERLRHIPLVKYKNFALEIKINCKHDAYKLTLISDITSHNIVVQMKRQSLLNSPRKRSPLVHNSALWNGSTNKIKYRQLHLSCSRAVAHCTRAQSGIGILWHVWLNHLYNYKCQLLTWAQIFVEAYYISLSCMISRNPKDTLICTRCDIRWKTTTLFFEMKRDGKHSNETNPC